MPLDQRFALFIQYGPWSDQPFQMFIGLAIDKRMAELVQDQP